MILHSLIRATAKGLEEQFALPGKTSTKAWTNTCTRYRGNKIVMYKQAVSCMLPAPWTYFCGSILLKIPVDVSVLSRYIVTHRQGIAIDMGMHLSKNVFILLLLNTTCCVSVLDTWTASKRPSLWYQPELGTINEESFQTRGQTMERSTKSGREQPQSLHETISRYRLLMLKHAREELRWKRALSQIPIVPSPDLPKGEIKKLQNQEPMKQQDVEGQARAGNGQESRKYNQNGSLHEVGSGNKELGKGDRHITPQNKGANRQKLGQPSVNNQDSLKIQRSRPRIPGGYSPRERQGSANRVDDVQPNISPRPGTSSQRRQGGPQTWDKDGRNVKTSTFQKAPWRP